ncbi:SRPBCC family protein [Streptomyces pactum]|uniref:SRPBCC family protein n=1 Tax=Streptomyces pactum TaxID=68249 RepID=A0ABS0NEB2_9ACTN|nr:SRPBCC family protein [Streptomyces pactum]MBH5333506.1 SRPBCC family protein [Streptomyces pactum]
MAVRHVLVPRTPEQVWSVLCDGNAYREWVVGTAESEELDDWPAVGSAIRYTVRIGPLRLHNETVVRISEPPRQLQLEARSGPLGSARIAIEVLPWGDDALIILDEHPLSGPGGRLHNVALDAVLQIRHRVMLQRLAKLVQRSTGPGAAHGGEGRAAPADAGPW